MPQLPGLGWAEGGSQQLPPGISVGGRPKQVHYRPLLPRAHPQRAGLEVGQHRPQAALV